MRLEVFCIFFIVPLSAAKHFLLPKFNGQDSAIIVDTGKKFPPSAPINAQPQHYLYPFYYLPPMGQQYRYTNFITKPTTPPTTTPSTTTTEATISPTLKLQLNTDDFPLDLLEIARQKLNLKRPEEIPTISELGELLGTSNAEETINYIRKLTTTEEGIALIKAYIESSDYTDNTSDKSTSQGSGLPKPHDYKNFDSNEAQVIRLQNAKKLQGSKSGPGFLQRLSAYLHSFLPQQKVAEAIETIKATQPELKHFTKLDKNLVKSQTPLLSALPRDGVQYKPPMLVRNPLPYHFPIPLRPVSQYPPSKFETDQPSAPASPHLNTPRGSLGAQIHLAKAIKISPEQLQKYLQDKPKLAELAAKVSRFPISHENVSVIENQLMSAMKRAMDEDEDLKKIFSSTETLK